MDETKEKKEFTYFFFVTDITTNLTSFSKIAILQENKYREDNEMEKPEPKEKWNTK